MRDGFLIDDAAGADVLVADLAVAHRALGQADIEAAGVDQRAGIVGIRRSSVGCLGELDGVDLVVRRDSGFWPQPSRMMRTNGVLEGLEDMSQAYARAAPN